MFCDKFWLILKTVGPASVESGLETSGHVGGPSLKEVNEAETQTLLILIRSSSEEPTT